MTNQNPLDPEFVQNPYPTYDLMRKEGQLFYWKDYGFYCSTQHKVVNDLLRDRRFASELPDDLAPEPPEHLREFYAFESRSILAIEPPSHTRIRALLTRAFTARRINAMAPEVRTLSHDLISAFPDGPFDLLTEFAEVIPVVVICRLLGVPEEMAPQLLTWSHDMVAIYQARRDRPLEDRTEAATVAFMDYIRDFVAMRRISPKNDLISELISARDKGEKLTEDELITTCILLLNAGHEATVHGISNGIKLLLETGIRFGQDDKENLKIIEETLRLDPPLHMFTRYALEDVRVGGHDFKRGEQVGLLLAAANRDPSVYENPQTFHPARNNARQLAFGAGLHFCIGAPMARMEMLNSMPILLKACPDLALTKKPVYADRYHFRGLEKLMVTR
ncbi:MAG: cytochrome P450 [Rhodobacteraceae bacterium]|nr:cytochrome P450 [Paracoccaceae bacterium]